MATPIVSRARGTTLPTEIIASRRDRNLEDMGGFVMSEIQSQMESLRTWLGQERRGSIESTPSRDQGSTHTLRRDLPSHTLGSGPVVADPGSPTMVSPPHLLRPQPFQAPPIQATASEGLTHTISETARSVENVFRVLESGIQSLQQQTDDEGVARAVGDDRLERRVEEIVAQLNSCSETGELRRGNQALHTRLDELTRENQVLRARVKELVAERSAAEMSASQRTQRPASHPRTSQSGVGHASGSHEATLSNLHPCAIWAMRTQMRRRGQGTRIDLVNRNPEGPQNNFVADDGLGGDGVIGKTSIPGLVAEELARMKRSTGCDVFIFTAQPVYFNTGQEHPGAGAAPLGEPTLTRLSELDEDEDRED
ncbi:hypothetical protein CEP52_003828 [Fusarium oligoseptatum]|uniref:Uncharacterized protein n=1 Tax=Fusarium oligoseptatum TaxID=2604345 RepID=A0A428U6S7_9HYPO|nr:hypothetical protein CEP52_003828 [Fusarium oligoseptatum]